jgi:hypothetical protein
MTSYSSSNFKFTSEMQTDLVHNVLKYEMLAHRLEILLNEVSGVQK